MKLSERTSAWIESELDAYMAARRAERGEKSTPATLRVESPYIRMGEVMKRTGLNNAALYELIRQRKFPKWASGPKRGSLWLASEVDDWLSANKAGSE